MSAAEFLLHARRAQERALAFPAALAPRTEAEAYAVQQEVMRALGVRPGGWKVAMSDVHNGTSAPVFATDVHDSPGHFAAAGYTSYGVEPEIAFRLAADLPPLPAGQRYARDAVLAAVGSAHAAIEIVLSRFHSHEGAPLLDRLADNGSNGGLIVGAAVTAWGALALADLPLTLRVAGERVHQGRGGHPQNDPLLPLCWLANHLAARGIGLARGQLVTTGSCAGLRYAAAGARVGVRFDGLGAAEVQLG
jgi:2-keto-4-pentenoate hydratase